MASFIFRILPPPAEFWHTIGPHDVALLVRYLEHLQRLRQDGPMRVVARSHISKCSFMLVEADTEAQAYTLARSDPAVIEGLMRLERHAPWSREPPRLRKSRHTSHAPDRR